MNYAFLIYWPEGKFTYYKKLKLSVPFLRSKYQSTKNWNFYLIVSCYLNSKIFKDFQLHLQLLHLLFGSTSTNEREEEQPYNYLSNLTFCIFIHDSPLIVCDNILTTCENISELTIEYQYIIDELLLKIYSCFGLRLVWYPFILHQFQKKQGKNYWLCSLFCLRWQRDFWQDL